MEYALNNFSKMTDHSFPKHNEADTTSCMCGAN